MSYICYMTRPVTDSSEGFDSLFESDLKYVKNNENTFLD